jgi:Mg2+/Co2+ transporter CorC
MEHVRHVIHRRWSSGLLGVVMALLRYAEAVATALDKDKLHDVLDQAVIVIDEKDLERSRKDPRVRAFHESSARLMAELEAEGANYD